jgi:hypothetical protein
MHGHLPLTGFLPLKAVPLVEVRLYCSVATILPTAGHPKSMLSLYTSSLYIDPLDLAGMM